MKYAMWFGLVCWCLGVHSQSLDAPAVPDAFWSSRVSPSIGDIVLTGELIRAIENAVENGCSLGFIEEHDETSRPVLFMNCLVFDAPDVSDTDAYRLFLLTGHSHHVEMKDQMLQFQFDWFVPQGVARVTTIDQFDEVQPGLYQQLNTEIALGMLFKQPCVALTAIAPGVFC